MQQTDTLFLKLIALGLGHFVANGEIQYQGEWKAVMQLALSLGLDAVAWDGLRCLCDGDVGSDEMLETALGDLKYEWFGYTLQCERDYAVYLQSLKDLTMFYNAEGIPVMLLKGYGLSLNYPVPSHRPTGDIDVYLFGEWEKADKVLHDKRNIKIDHTHHHHSVFKIGTRLVENHYDFLNIYAHRSSRRLEMVLKGIAQQNWSEHELNGSSIRLPGVYFNALFLLRHAASHFASVALNLRQVLDWLLFVERSHDEIDWPWLYGILRQENMIRFANTLNAIGVDYLGFNRALFPEIEEDHELVKRVLDEILHPSFVEKEDGTLIKSLWVKVSRWWHNRWKHKICYSDSLLSSFLHSLHAKILKPSHFLH